MVVRIRMTMLGRKHRPFYRIVAIDGRQPRDGRIIEELGTYDPMVKDKAQRVKLKPDRIKYWLGVGAQPSDKCQMLFKKFMKKAEEDAAAAKPQSTATAPAALPTTKM
jgi:small subunit ribosomal protein S16